MSIQNTLNQREKTHGSFSINATISQELKSVIRPYYDELSADKREALDMICHKISRILTGNANEPDHWHDITGYAALVERQLTS